MATEIKVPSPGESITQVQLAKWLVTDGDAVEKDQEVVEIDSDKASFPIAAPEEGVIRIRAAEGDTIPVGEVIAVIEPSAGAASGPKAAPKTEPALPAAGKVTEPSPVPASSGHEKAAEPVNVTPLARRIMEEKQIRPAELSVAFPGKKLTRKDVEAFAAGKRAGIPVEAPAPSRTEERKKMTTLRLKLAERLVSVKNQTAMLTTFNEINMQAALRLKDKYGEAFREKHGVGVGLMSLFTKAVTLALQDFPQVNSMIDGEELIMPHYADIGIAVSAPKGLVVPVLRNAETMSLPEIERQIKALAAKARENRITIDDMKGGTFTITNGGVFGSLMSTPILNPPQSAILGMHKIQERPVAVNGQVVIAPMMYVALSYDHRVIDGRESVGFLVRVKELIEEPALLLTGGQDPLKLLLDL